MYQLPRRHADRGGRAAADRGVHGRRADRRRLGGDHRGIGGRRADSVDRTGRPTRDEADICAWGSSTFGLVTLLTATLAISEDPNLSGAIFPNVESRQGVAEVMNAILADTEGMVAALAPGPVLDALNGVRAQALALRDVMLAQPTAPWTPEGNDAFEAATATFQSARS